MKNERFEEAVEEAKRMVPVPKLSAGHVIMAASKEKPSNRKKLWIGLGSAFGTVATAGIVLAVSLGAFNGTSIIPSSSDSAAEVLSTLALPENDKKTNDRYYTRSLSQTTYDSYLSFIPKFGELMLGTAEEGKSLGLSIPDAYLCFALTAYTSVGATQREWLDFLGLASEAEVLTAANEVRQALCMLREDDDGNLFGGYNINALWFNLAKVRLLEGKEDQYQEIANAFDAALFQDALTTDKAYDFLKDCGLPGLPVPEMQFPDDDPYAAASMSVFYCLDSFGDMEEIYGQQYRDKNHYMDYTLDGSIKSVDYISRSNVGYVYDGTGFHGASLPIYDLISSYFLTDEVGGDPASIFDAVLSQDYQKTTYIDENSELESSQYNVTIDSPYFKINTDLGASDEKMSEVFPSSTVSGLFEKLATGYDGGIFLSAIKQMSTMYFDYSGFYSCSVTVVGGNTESLGPSGSFNLELDRPFVFQISQPGVRVGELIKEVPMVFGEVYDPAYPAYGG